MGIFCLKLSEPDFIVGDLDATKKSAVNYLGKVNSSPILSKVYTIVTRSESDTYIFIFGIVTGISISLLTSSIPEFRSFTDHRDILISLSVLVMLLLFNMFVFWFASLFLKIKNEANIFVLKESLSLPNEVLRNKEKYAQLYLGCYLHRKRLYWSYLLSLIFGIFSLVSIIVDAICHFGD